MKKTVLFQYQEIVDKAAKQAVGLSTPPEGWLKTMRKALGMSGAQLGRVLGVSRSQVAQSERNELTGAITLKTLHTMAEAMGGRVVYTIVPSERVEALISKRAKVKARQIVEKTSTHMALENQALGANSLQFELRRIEQELLKEMPSDFWDDV
jgi:predicted DNA-binding mobile mystery protein A